MKLFEIVQEDNIGAFCNKLRERINDFESRHIGTIITVHYSTSYINGLIYTALLEIKTKN